jgi:hypothetical protein
MAGWRTYGSESFMMKPGLVHHGIAWLLSAALLLTNGLPISVEHAHHISGSLAHHEHVGQAVACAVRPIKLAEAAQASMDDITDHLHLLWLGWEFTVPTPQDQEPGTHAAASSELLARLETLGDSHSATTVDDPADADCMGLPTSPAPASIIAGDSGSASFFCSAPAARHLAALPLCDAARHARSGVQLA